jgi:hypothetical protein
MTRTLMTLIIVVLYINCKAQNTCIKHWSLDGSSNYKLDSFYKKLNFSSIDSVVCDEYVNTNPFDHEWFIKYYNKQLGKYFSEAQTVNFTKFYAKEKSDSIFDEIHIIQFDLPQTDLDKFKKKFGTVSEGYRYYQSKVLCFYKYLVNGNSVFFISTESYHRGSTKETFFDRIHKEFANLN